MKTEDLSLGPSSLALCLAAGTAAPSARGSTRTGSIGNPDRPLPPRRGACRRCRRCERSSAGSRVSAARAFPADGARRARPARAVRPRRGRRDGRAGGAIAVIPALAPPAGARFRPADDRSARTTGRARAPATAARRCPHRRWLARPAQPHSGQLTAGDHDDLLNPELYADYVGDVPAGQRIHGVPFVDTAPGADRRGPGPCRPAGARSRASTLTCADGNSLRLRRSPTARVAFFPALDRLGRRSGCPSLRGGARQAARGPSPRPAPARSGRVTLAGAAAPVHQLRPRHRDRHDRQHGRRDRLSAGRAARDPRRPAAAAIRDLDIRLALVAYRDLGDDYVTRTFPFTGDVDRMQRSLRRAVRPAAAATIPKRWTRRMARALALDWRPDAVTLAAAGRRRAAA